VVPLRKVEEADYPVIAEFHNRVSPWAMPLSPELIAHFVRIGDPHRPTYQVKASDGNEAIGLGVLAASPVTPASTLIVEVDEQYRGRGIGSALLDWLARKLRAPRFVSASVSESCAAGISFAHRHGLEERSRTFPSVLALTGFEPRRFTKYVDEAKSAGVRFTTFAAADSARMRHAIHELHNASQVDVPSAARLLPEPFDEWKVAWLDAPWFRADLLTIALVGPRPVALSYVVDRPGGDGYNAFTGVAGDWRGRGLATATKVESLRLAKAAGMREVSTDNHSNNLSMLAVNARLGYKRRTGVIQFMGTLKPIPRSSSGRALRPAGASRAAASPGTSS
jgi:GNAT superfamily N-acetyltransferase